MLCKMDEKYLKNDTTVKEFKGHYYKREQINVAYEDELSMYRGVTKVGIKLDKDLFRLEREMTIKGAKTLIEEHNKERGGE